MLTRMLPSVIKCDSLFGRLSEGQACRMLTWEFYPGFSAIICASMPIVAEIQVEINKNYNLKTQEKYVPIKGIKIDKEDCVGVFKSRENLLPDTLVIEGGGLDAAVKKRTMISVVSGARAKWISENINKPITAISQEIIYPIYSPLGGGETILFVNYNEYPTYKRLVGDKVKVIGCRYEKSNSPLLLDGFGASRLCALKYLKDQNVENAWFMDDNLFAVYEIDYSNVINPAKNKQLDNALTEKSKANANSSVFLTFKPAFENQSIEKIRGIITSGKADDEAKFLTKLTKLMDQGHVIIQQGYALYGIPKLGKLNFSPMFVTSNEDTSFSFVAKRAGHRPFQNMDFQILKADPVNENDKNRADALNNLKQSIFQAHKDMKIKDSISGKIDSIDKSLQPLSTSSGDPVSNITLKAVEKIMRTCVEKFNDFDHYFSDDKIRVRYQ